MKNKILLFIKIPPPYTGVTYINDFISNRSKINNNFNVRSIKMSYSKNIRELGKINYFKFFKVIIYSIKLIRELFVFHPNLVYFQISHTRIAFLRDLFYITLIKMFNVKILYHLHGTGINIIAKRSAIMKRLYKYTFKNSNVICLSPLLLYDIKSVYKGKPYILPNGVKKQCIELNNNEPNKIFNIIFLANLIKSKGVLDLLDAIEILKNSENNFKLSIIGGEGDIIFSKLRDEINVRNLDNFVEYLGPKYGKDKYKLLQNADVFCYPTHKDAFPLVILEAMQAGIPVIATREGAIPEIVDNGVTGFIVDKNSPEKVAEKLVTLIKNPELLIKMKMSGRNLFLRNYTLEKFDMNMLKIFNHIIRENL